MVKAILAVFLIALATASAGIEQDAADAQEKFFFNFPWIALPNIPTRPPVVAVPTVVTPTISACTTTASGKTATKAAGDCTCGTPAKNCVANDICTVDTAGVGTCTTTLSPCPAAAATTPTVCECGTGAAAIVCISPTNICAAPTTPACT